MHIYAIHYAKENATMSETKKKHIAYKPIISYDGYIGSNPIVTAAIVMQEDGIVIARHGSEDNFKEWFEGFDEIGLLPVPTVE